jgi:hypothetical protein
MIIYYCLRRPGALFVKTAPGPRKNFSYTVNHCTTLLSGISHWDHFLFFSSCQLPTARRAIKSFSGGPGGRFFKKAPLAAGGNYKTKLT